MKTARAFELAKELGVTTRELLDHLKKSNLPAKQAISLLTQAQVDAAMEKFTAAPAKQAATEPGVPSGSGGRPRDESASPGVFSPKTASEAGEAPERGGPAGTVAVAAPPAPPPPTPPSPPPPARRIYAFAGSVSLAELAKALDLHATDIIKALLMDKMQITLNQRVGIEVVRKIGEKFSFDVVEKTAAASAAPAAAASPAGAHLKPRAPVVTIMGHVDHGKTSLLDAIRQTDVAGGEAGGITQHIGAYRVSLPGRGDVVFLDTPGHEAFSALRARGAKVTDVVVLVVAADDGVMPQTIEAIDHARAAGVPIVVAVNKMDKPDANPQRVKQELAARDLAPEEWGGKTIMVEVSARQKTGLDKLLEMLLLEAELLELKADPAAPPHATVLEARVHKSRGPVATILVQQGTLRIGDIITCGSAYGRVRMLLGSRGEQLAEAGPATPVELLGLSQVTEPGAVLRIARDERDAREAAERWLAVERDKRMLRRHITLQDVSQSVKSGEVKELRVVIKADVQGSLEALVTQVSRLANDQVKLLVIHQGVGPINASDIALAAASDAVILGFHVLVEPQAEPVARREEVEIRRYDIIYEAVDELKRAMEGLLSPKVEEVPLGRVEVRQIFRTPRGPVAGCFVASGKAVRGEKLRLSRAGQVLHTGTLTSLRRFKEDVKEVATGYECGIFLESWHDVQIGDILDLYTQEMVQEKLRI